MRYKVGDKVYIKSWESMANKYGVDDFGCIKVPFHFIPDMRKYCRQIFTISSIKYLDPKTLLYRMEEVGCNWSKEMFVNSQNSIEYYLNEREKNEKKRN